MKISNINPDSILEILESRKKIKKSIDENIIIGTSSFNNCLFTNTGYMIAERPSMMPTLNILEPRTFPIDNAL